MPARGDRASIGDGQRNKRTANIRNAVAEALISKPQPIQTSSAEGRPQPFRMESYLEFRRMVPIQTKDRGLISNVPMLGSQRYVIEQIANGLSEGIADFKILKGRQQGVTTELRILQLFWMFMHRGLLAAYVIHEDKARELYRQHVNVHYDGLPRAYKKPRKLENRAMCRLSNDSILMYLVAGTRERQSGMGRSGSYNFLFADEVAEWGTPDDIKQFEATMSLHYPYRLYLWASTAKGFNHFADMCSVAQSSPTQRFIFSPWCMNELLTLPESDPAFAAYGIAPATRSEARKIHVVQDSHGVEVTRGQLAWYRWYLAEKCHGDRNIMDQEFPWSPDDAFVASGSKYFSNSILTDATRRVRSIPYKAYRFELSDLWEETEIHPATPNTCDLKIWEEATPDGVYVIGCDPAYGSSGDADRSVVSVWRCFADRCYQVAEYVTNKIATCACAWVLAYLAGYYRGALVMLEVTGPGQDVQFELRRLRSMMAQKSGEWPKLLETMRLYIYRRADSLGGSTGYIGLKMTHEIRWLSIGGLKTSFEIRQAVVNSSGLLEEMRNVIVKDGNLDVRPHAKDDRVCAAGHAVYGWKTQIQLGMIADGRTFEREIAGTLPQPRRLEVQVLDYLKKLRIDVPGATPETGGMEDMQNFAAAPLNASREFLGVTGAFAHAAGAACVPESAAGKIRKEAVQWPIGTLA